MSIKFFRKKGTFYALVCERIINKKIRGVIRKKKEEIEEWTDWEDADRSIAHLEMELSSTDLTNYLNYTVSGPVDWSRNDSSTWGRAELNLPYAVCEVIVAVCAVLGNALVIIVFSKDRKLRRRTNYYIISLATADLLVGLFAIPFAILASIGLPTNLYACLFTVSVLVVLCTISIFCLVAVSVDRYWAIIHPMGYSRNVRTKTAIGKTKTFFIFWIIKFWRIFYCDSFQELKNRIFKF